MHNLNRGNKRKLGFACTAIGKMILGEYKGLLRAHLSCCCRLTAENSLVWQWRTTVSLYFLLQFSWGSYLARLSHHTHSMVLLRARPQASMVDTAAFCSTGSNWFWRALPWYFAMFSCQVCESNQAEVGGTIFGPLNMQTSTRHVQWEFWYWEEDETHLTANKKREELSGVWYVQSTRSNMLKMQNCISKKEWGENSGCLIQQFNIVRGQKTWNIFLAAVTSDHLNIKRN